jgi:hypothetical protein
MLLLPPSPGSLANPCCRLSTSLNLLQLLRDCWNCLKWSCVCEVCYKNGEQVEDKPSVGRPSTSDADDNVKRVRSLVRSNRRLMLRMIRSELNSNWFTVHQISTWDLGMRKVWAKMVPKTLTTEQKANRQTLPVSRQREWANPKSNQCSFVFVFFTVRASSTRNLCHQDKLSIRLFIGKSSKDSW